jgi:hypothetical protein
VERIGAAAGDAAKDPRHYAVMKGTGNILNKLPFRFSIYDWKA